jgi:hypothetical protein
MGRGESPCLVRKVPTLQKRGPPSVASYRRTVECLGFSLRGALARFRHTFSASASRHTSTESTRSGSTESAVIATSMHPSNSRARETRPRKSGDVAVPIVGIHEFLAGNDDHVSPQGGRVRCARSVWKREVTRRLGVTELLDHATAADPGHVHAENGFCVGRPEAVAPPNGGPVAI